MLLLVGLLVVGLLTWQYAGTNWVAHRQQLEIKERLAERWAEGQPAEAGPEDLVPGGAFALVRIPRFGDEYEVPLLVGVNDRDLSRGIGWFPDTSLPGAVGNFAVAAHRVTHGEPFRRFLDLRAGDEVVVETRGHVFVYVLAENGYDRTVDFKETWILDPTPKGSRGGESMITLVTCASVFHTDERNVATGFLESSSKKPLDAADSNEGG